MATQIQLRRDIAANWTTDNPTLAVGELGLDQTNNAFKLGDGATAWNSLAYYAVPVASFNKSVGSTTTAGAVTLTAAQLLAGYFADGATQTAAFTLTTDTAANLLAAFPTAAVGTSFKVRIINNDQSVTGYAGTLAGGTGVTVQTSPLVNPAIPKGGIADFLFVFTDVTSGAAALSVYALGAVASTVL